MFPLVLRGDKLGAAIELIDDLENRLFAALGRRLRDQKPPYPEVGRGALRSGISEYAASCTRS